VGDGKMEVVEGERMVGEVGVMLSEVVEYPKVSRGLISCIEEGFEVGLDGVLFFRMSVEAFQIGEERGDAFFESGEEVRSDEGLEG